MCGNTGPLYATSNQLCAPLQHGATTEGLCAFHGSPESQVTRVVDEHMLVARKGSTTTRPKITRTRGGMIPQSRSIPSSSTSIP